MMCTYISLDGYFVTLFMLSCRCHRDTVCVFWESLVHMWTKHLFEGNRPSNRCCIGFREKFEAGTRVPSRFLKFYLKAGDWSGNIPGVWTMPSFLMLWPSAKVYVQEWNQAIHIWQENRMNERQWLDMILDKRMQDRLLLERSTGLPKVHPQEWRNWVAVWFLLVKGISKEPTKSFWLRCSLTPQSSSSGFSQLLCPWLGERYCVVHHWSKCEDARARNQDEWEWAAEHSPWKEHDYCGYKDTVGHLVPDVYFKWQLGIMNTWHANEFETCANHGPKLTGANVNH